MTHTKKQDRAITRTAGAGQTVPLEVGQGLGKEEHDEAAGDAQHQEGGEGHPEHAADLVPPARALASEMVLDMATGRPAWEIISSRL